MIKLVDKKPSRFGKKKGVRRMKKYLCEFCNKEFIDFAWREAKFCCSKCYWKAKKGSKVFQYISKEEKLRRRNRMLGENNPMWCGGDSDRLRRNSEYKNWRITVFKRDKFTCQKCGYYHGDGTKRKDLHAHHIVKWIDSLELRYVVENGITLCIPCHIKEHANIV